MAAQLKLNSDTYLPLRDVVFHTLRDAILRGDLQPGERLMEIHLAQELGVSRTPVREAIRMLEKEGLAVTIPRRGAHVARMTEKDLEDVLEIRDVLDELAARDACERMNDEDFEDLSDAMKHFRSVVKSRDVRAIAEADEQFHDVIYTGSKNPKLVNIVRNLKEQMYRFRFEYLKKIDDYSILISEHEAIMEALKNRDRALVTEKMHEHLKNQVEAVRTAIRAMDETEEK